MIRTATQLLVAVIVASPLIGQRNPPIEPNSLIGCWQSDTAEVSDGPTNCYRFFPDGKFIFEFSSYDETKRIVSLHGTYSLKMGLISFVIMSRVEREGGRIERSPQSASGWYLRNGKLVTLKQANPEPEETDLALCSKPRQKPLCITIGGSKFFQMSSNPRHKIGAN